MLFLAARVSRCEWLHRLGASVQLQVVFYEVCFTTLVVGVIVASPEGAPSNKRLAGAFLDWKG
jgi:hypothetical protein